MKRFITFIPLLLIALASFGQTTAEQHKKKHDWWSNNSSGQVAQVAFQEAGDGVAIASAVTNLAAPLPVTGLQAGDIFFLQVGVQSTNGQVSTPAGWTLWITNQSSSVGHQWVFYKRSDGTESGNVTVPMLVNVANVKLARVYRFRGGESLEDPFLGNGGVTLPGVANISTINTTTITAPTLPGVAKSLGVCFTYVVDDATFPAFTGETNGDWIMPTPIYLTTIGSDSALGLQTNTFSSSVTVSGGTSTSDRSATYVQIAATLLSTDIEVQLAMTGRLYERAGQSNLAGRGVCGDIVGRPELLLAIPRSYIWWYSNTGGYKWRPVQACVNGSDVDGQFGSLPSFAYAEHIKYPTVDKFYVSAGLGGTTIAQWNSTLFPRTFMQRHNAALQTLTPTVWAGITWMQSENDALSDALGIAYEAAEQTLMASFFANTSHTQCYVVQLHNLPTGSFPGRPEVQTSKSNNFANGHYGAGVNVGALIIPPECTDLHFPAMQYVTIGESESVVYP